ncbi:MAG TPA: putative quinol monooxygenase [Roseiflexaceae bacterium]|nr:putative quinol monooxygenase [Roseiflexaceae bacterium]
MIVLVVKYYVNPGHGDAVAEALTRMAQLVREREPGCRMYHVCRATDNPDTFLLYEQYDDEAARAAHRATPHFQEIVEGTVRPLLQDSARELYTLVAG